MRTLPAFCISWKSLIASFDLNDLEQALKMDEISGKGRILRQLPHKFLTKYTEKKKVKMKFYGCVANFIWAKTLFSKGTKKTFGKVKMAQKGHDEFPRCISFKSLLYKKKRRIVP